jgi:signal transduction histidine kinase
VTLSRRIFAWFVAIIVATACAVGVASAILLSAAEQDASLGREVPRVFRFMGANVALVWDEPSRRDEMVRQMASESGFTARLEGPNGERIVRAGPICTSRPWKVPVVSRDGQRLGSLTVCINRNKPKATPSVLIGALLVLSASLWLASWAVARMLARPLGELAEVASRIGRGDLEARAISASQAGPEVAAVADAMHEMAARIERQIRDQRTLLAAVSHELRTPLGHMRLIVEMARDGAAPRLDELEREVIEMDDLVDQLLVTSRLDFALQEQRALDVVELCIEALERAGLGIELLEVRAEEGSWEKLEVLGDPTLLRRALANLLRNAREHGGGVVTLAIEPGEGGQIGLVVEDDGPGLGEVARERLFEAFVQLPAGAQQTRGALGLGLYLVRRVASAHSGDVIAQTRPEGGARVGLSLKAL